MAYLFDKQEERLSKALHPLPVRNGVDGRKRIIKNNHLVQHQGVSVCLDGMKVHLYQLGLGLLWLSHQCSQSLPHGGRAFGPSVLTCLHHQTDSQLKGTKHHSCPSIWLAFALLHLLSYHLLWNLSPRAVTLHNWAAAATFAATRTSATCLRPCDQVGKVSC